MAKIVNLDGSAAGTEKLIEDLTLDEAMRKLANCTTCGDLKKLWLGRECDTDDIQVALLMQLVGDIQHLGNAIAVLLSKLETLTAKSNSRIN